MKKSMINTFGDSESLVKFKEMHGDKLQIHNWLVFKDEIIVDFTLDVFEPSNDGTVLFSLAGSGLPR